MGILHQFYNGEIIPYERSCPRHPDYDRLCEEACRMEDQIKELLPEEERDFYERALNRRLDEVYLENEQAFVDGYRLGVLLLLDVLRPEAQ